MNKLDLCFNDISVNDYVIMTGRYKRLYFGKIIGFTNYKIRCILLSSLEILYKYDNDNIIIHSNTITDRVVLKFHDEVYKINKTDIINNFTLQNKDL